MYGWGVVALICLVVSPFHAINIPFDGRLVTSCDTRFWNVSHGFGASHTAYFIVFTRTTMFLFNHTVGSAADFALIGEYKLLSSNPRRAVADMQHIHCSCTEHSNAVSIGGQCDIIAVSNLPNMGPTLSLYVLLQSSSQLERAFDIPLLPTFTSVNDVSQVAMVSSKFDDDATLTLIFVISSSNKIVVRYTLILTFHSPLFTSVLLECRF
jgi:hypothetical protein